MKSKWVKVGVYTYIWQINEQLAYKIETYTNSISYILYIESVFLGKYPTLKQAKNAALNHYNMVINFSP